MPLTQRIAFLGGGVMATAILRSLLAAGVVTPDQVTVSDPNEASRAAAEALGARTTAVNHEAVEAADVVVLAVKPYLILDVLEEIEPVLGEGHLLVSIAAGIGLRELERMVTETAVIRVMPNTPVQVGAGAVAFSRGHSATNEHAETVREMFGAGGLCLEVTDGQMDAVTALSGSGPAYAFLMMEALADGAVRQGLPRATAQQLAAQTLLGAAKLVLETGEHPAVLKDRVTTPGGTTIAGLAAMEAAGVRSGLIQAVEAAARRSREMSQG